MFTFAFVFDFIFVFTILRLLIRELHIVHGKAEISYLYRLPADIQVANQKSFVNLFRFEYNELRNRDSCI